VTQTDTTPDGADAGGGDALATGGLVLLSRIVAQASQFLIFLAAVRFLTTAQFGVFALAIAVAVLMQQIAQAGWGQFILSGRCRRSRAGFVQGVAIASGIIFSIVGVLVGLAMRAWMGEPTLGNIVMLVSPTIVFLCFASTNESVLLRENRVTVVAGIWISAELVGLVVGIATLFMGWNEYGLVAARISVAGVRTGLNLFVNSGLPTLIGPRAEWRELLEYYRDLLVTTLLNYTGGYSGLFIIGIFFGASVAGIYRAASRFASALMEFIWEPSGILAWKDIPPTEAEIETGEPMTGIVAERYLSFLGFFAFLVSPMMLGAAAVAPELTGLLLGREWLAAGPIFSLLVIANLFLMPALVSGPVFSALGYSARIMQLKMVQVLGTLALLLSIGWISPIYAAGAHIPSAVILSVVAFWIVSRILEVKFSDAIGAVSGPFLCAVGMAVAVSLLRIGLASAGWPLLAILAVSILAGMAVYLLLATVFCRDVMRRTADGLLKVPVVQRVRRRVGV